MSGAGCRHRKEVAETTTMEQNASGVETGLCVECGTSLVRKDGDPDWAVADPAVARVNSDRKEVADTPPRPVFPRLPEGYFFRVSTGLARVQIRRKRLVGSTLESESNVLEPSATHAALDVAIGWAHTRFVGKNDRAWNEYSGIPGFN